MRCFLPLAKLSISLIILLSIAAARDAVALDTLGAYLTKNGYGGAL